MNGPDFAEIKAELLNRLPALVKDLLPPPDGRRNGKYWICKNPTRADKHAGSMWVLMEGPAAGAWRDEAGIRGVDDGDIVDLVGYVLRCKDRSATRTECLKWLGWASGKALQLSPEEKARRAKLREQEAEKRQAEDRQRAIDRLKTGGENALRRWLKAAALTPATFSGSLLDHYFRHARGIDLVRHFIERGRALPGALRFFASYDYLTLDGEVIEGLPCMPALMSGPDGKPQALHSTWLQPDGSDKAQLPDPADNGPRKIWGPPKGAVIRIAKGAGALTPEAAAKAGRRGPLIVTEGIEDALAVAIAMPEHRVWAAGTLGNIENVPVLPCISTIIVCRDNDWSKPQAVQAFERAVRTLKRSGKPVKVAASPKGKDMNDLLKGATI